MILKLSVFNIFFLLKVLNGYETPQSIVLPNPPSADKAKCQLVNNNDRLDCIPHGNASQDLCEARGCCWSEDIPNLPVCFYQPGFFSYTFKNVTVLSDGLVAYLERSYQSPYPRDVAILKLVATYVNDNILRLKIIDPLNQRYESIYPKVDVPSATAEHPKYNISIETDTQGFRIIRNSDNTTIFDASDLANFIYSDQFIQLTTKLPSTNLYGLGEHKDKFRLNTNWSTYTLFSRDAAPIPNFNLYGSHPFYLLLENSSKAHGVLLKNSNGIDVIIQPSPALTYRTIGGVLDLYFFLGPTPSDVLTQYQEIIGKPKMPPYWGLGFQLSRYGINNLNAVKTVLQRNLDAGIPVETQWNDLDYMNRNNDFTYNNNTFNGLPEFVKELHEQGRRYVILIDPGVGAGEPRGSYPPFDEGINLDVFVKNSSGDVLLAQVWNPGGTAFPDFTNPKTYNYWYSLLKTFHNLVPFDGIWLDMNEPSNFHDGSLIGCPQSDLDSPPYVPHVLGGKLNALTICMSAKQFEGVHYNLHNLYGISETEVTSRSVEEVLGERSFIIARSTFPGSGAYAGHWNGDIASSWEDLEHSIPSLLHFSLFGIPLMGSDICGFSGSCDTDLCNRWMQLGAFYPFSRNHNTQFVKEQDPAAMGEQVIRSSLKALRIRYQLLPYLYTLFWQANQNGSTVARPLMVEFPEDPNTYDIDDSFLWGSGLLIVPVLESDPPSITAYFPKGIWYNYYSSEALNSLGQFSEIKTDKDTIPLFIRGGQILPIQEYGNTTEEVRKSDYSLLAALDNNGEARGLFYWDNGISVDVGDDYTLLSFEVENGELKIEELHQGTTPPPQLSAINILGVSDDNYVSVTGSQIYDYTYDHDIYNQRIIIENLQVDKYPITITWH